MWNYLANSVFWEFKRFVKIYRGACMHVSAPEYRKILQIFISLIYLVSVYMYQKSDFNKQLQKWQNLFTVDSTLFLLGFNSLEIALPVLFYFPFQQVGFIWSSFFRIPRSTPLFTVVITRKSEVGVHGRDNEENSGYFMNVFEPYNKKISKLLEATEEHFE